MKKNKSAVYIICPSLGIGEIYTIKRLSDVLAQCAITSYFIGPEYVQDIADIKQNYNSFQENKADNMQMLSQIISDINPEFIMFTDYNIYCNRYFNYQDLFGFQDLKSYNIPVYIIDTLGNCSYEQTSVSLYDKKQTVIVPDFVKSILRPVPQHDPIVTEKNSKLHYISLFMKDDISNDQCSVKEKLHFNQDEKVVIMPLGCWVEKVSSKDEFRLFKSYIRIILHYLNCIGDIIRVCILGECDFDFIEFNNLIIDNSFINCSFDQVDELFCAADLVITLNQFSNSIVRAVLHQIPCIAFINSYEFKLVDGNIKTEFSELVSNYINKILKLNLIKKSIKKFRMFPESNVSTMETFFQYNKKFCSQFITEEIFDETRVIKVINEILYKKNEQLVSKQQNFVNKSKKLKSITSLIMEDINGTCKTDL